MGETENMTRKVEKREYTEVLFDPYQNRLRV